MHTLDTIRKNRALISGVSGVEEAFACSGLNWHDHVIIDPTLYRPTEISVNRGNPAKATRILGWKARSAMRDVVRMMVEQESESSAHARCNIERRHRVKL